MQHTSLGLEFINVAITLRFGTFAISRAKNFVFYCWSRQEWIMCCGHDIPELFLHFSFCSFLCYLALLPMTQIPWIPSCQGKRVKEEMNWKTRKQISHSTRWLIAIHIPLLQKQRERLLTCFFRGISRHELGLLKHFPTVDHLIWPNLEAPAWTPDDLVPTRLCMFVSINLLMSRLYEPHEWIKKNLIRLSFVLTTKCVRRRWINSFQGH